MTNQQHPITSPSELVEDWLCEPEYSIRGVIDKAAQWGADQELDACEKWLEWNHSDLLSRELRAARRPKPPSLKEQALSDLTHAYNADKIDDTTFETLRRALEQLDD